VCAHIGEPGLDFGNAMRVLSGFRLFQELRALAVGLEHHLEQTLRAVRRFLRQTPDTPARRQFHAAVFGRNVAGHHVEQRGLAGAVAADKADPGAGDNAGRRSFKQCAAGNAYGEIVDDKHCAPFGVARTANQSPIRQEG
jgi:hypothetical protein